MNRAQLVVAVVGFGLAMLGGAGVWVLAMLGVREGWWLFGSGAAGVVGVLTLFGLALESVWFRDEAQRYKNVRLLLLAAMDERLVEVETRTLLMACDDEDLWECAKEIDNDRG